MLAMRFHERTARALHAGWARSWPTSLLALGVGLSRWPFLSAGYGLDPDAHRVANAAWEIAHTGRYTASRLPGYPLQECLLALVHRGGPRFENGASALMSCLASVALSRCLRASGVREHLALAAGFAAVPVIYVNSTCAMDYVWAVALTLCAAHAALRQRGWRAGVWLGLAIGARITSAAMILPLWLLCGARAPTWQRGVRTAARLTLAAVGGGAICFAPVFARYGTKFLTFYESLGGGTSQVILRRATLGVWGPLGMYALALAGLCVLLSAQRARRRLPRQPRLWISGACVCAMAIYSAAYLRLPLEAGYLAPLVPFTIWGLALWQTRVPNWLLSALLCAAAFLQPGAGGLELTGPLLMDHAQRLEQQAIIQRSVELLSQLERPSVLIAGYYLPALESAGLRKGKTPHQLRNLLKNPQQLKQLTAAGVDVYYLNDGIERYQRRFNGVRLRNSGARALMRRYP